ncbi:MAG: glycosyltransferase family 2 protein [Eubacterium sp.]|nr:glycosyltransferase family 2 protein [Eubacterium sp.]
MDSIDLSVVMPCLNEEKTVGNCIREAQKYIKDNGISGEIIVVDNKSDDASAKVAKRSGARVLIQKRRGYGIAIRTGIRAAKGKVIIICDCDMTYDIYHLDDIYIPLKTGEYEVMIGDRLKNTDKGAMPLSHKIGGYMLSLLGRLRYHVDVRDFHCGLRGITKEAVSRLEFRTEGMEFATEMIAEAAAADLLIGQTEVVLRRCPYDREPKLRTVRDGFRHLIFILAWRKDGRR